MIGPKYPEIYVPLIGENGNAYSIIFRVTEALRRARVSREERAAFEAEATAGDYGHLLRTVAAWVEITPCEDSDDWY